MLTVLRRWLAPARHSISSARDVASAQATEAMLALLAHSLTEGHTRLSLPAFYERVERVPELRHIAPADLTAALAALQKQQHIWLSDNWLALPQCVLAEQQCALGLPFEAPENRCVK